MGLDPGIPFHVSHLRNPNYAVPEKWPKRRPTTLDAFDLSSGEAGSIKSE